MELGLERHVCGWGQSQKVLVSGWVQYDFRDHEPRVGVGHVPSPLDGIKEPLLHSCSLGGFRFLTPKWPARQLRGVIET